MNLLRNLKHMGIIALSLGFLLPGTVARAASLESITGESQILPIEDGSEKYILKSDAFYCLKADGGKDAAAAVHYFDHVEMDGTVLNGFYYHDETGHFSAGQSHLVKLTNLTCETSDASDAEAGEEAEADGTDTEASTVTFDGIYMVNNLGKLTAAPQVHYISNYVLNGVTYDGYYFFDENGKMITETGAYELHQTSNGRTFDGTYYFGGTNGVLVQEAATTEDGFPVDETGLITGLDDLGMDTLKPQLESMLVGYDGTWSVYVKDLDTGEDFSVNNMPLYSASLIKAFVMAKTYENMDAVLENEAAYMKTTVDNAAVPTKVNDLLWNMITVSDNESCNELARLQSDAHDFLKGAEEVDLFIQEEGFADTTFQSTLHPSSSSSQSLGGRNTTTVEDCGRLLEMIYNGECVSEEASAEMMNLLLNQQNTAKIPAGISGEIQTANKTGETDEDQHDIAIVWGPKTTYILCVMSQDFSNGNTAIENIRSISKVVYNYLNL